MSQWQIVTDATTAAVESEGSALEENEKVLDSITGKTNKFKSAFQELSNNIINSDFVKHIIDFGTLLLKIADTGIGRFILKLAALVAIIAAARFGIKQISPAFRDLMMVFKDFSFYAKYSTSILAEYLLILKGVPATEAMVQASTMSLAETFKLLTATMLKNPLFWVGAGLLAITGIIKLIAYVNTATERQYKKAIEKLNSVKEELDGVNSELDKTKSRIEELEGKTSLTFVEKDELKNLQKQNKLLEERSIILNKQKKDAEKAVQKAAAKKAAETVKEVPRTSEEKVGVVDYNKGLPDMQIDYNTNAPKMSITVEEDIKNIEKQQKIIDELQKQMTQTGICTKEMDAQMKAAEASMDESADAVNKQAEKYLEAAQTEGLAVELQEYYLEKYYEYLKKGSPNKYKDLKLRTILGADSLDAKNFNNELLELSKSEQLNAEQVAILLEKYPYLKEQLEEAGITAQDLVDNFKNVNSVIEKNVITFDDYVKRLKNIEDSVTAVESAISEFNESGSISYETFSSLKEAGLLEYLKVTENGIVANTQALYNQEAALKDLAVATLQNAAVNDINNLALGKTEDLSNTAKTALENFKLKLDATAYSGLDASGKLALFNKTLQDTYKAAKGELGEGVDPDKFKQDAQVIIDAYNSIAGALIYTSSKAKQASSSKSKSDKEWWETELEKLKKQFQYNEITIEEYISGLENLLGKVEKGTDAWRQINEELQKQKLTKVESDYKRGVISLDEYIKKLKELIKAYKEGSEAWNDLADKIKKALQDKAKAQKDDLNTAEKAAVGIIDDEIDRLKKLQEAEEERYDKLIEEKQKANDETERELELARLQEALENAKKERTKRVWREGLGWQWEADQTAIDEAQKALDDFLNEQEINDLEKKKDEVTKNFEDQIKALENYKETWENVASDYETAQARIILAQQLGADAEAQILQQRLGVLEEYKSKYLATMEEIAKYEKTPSTSLASDTNGGATGGGSGANGSSLAGGSSKAPSLSAGSYVSVKPGAKWYANSYGGGNSGLARSGTIKYINSGGSHPYNIDGLGWVSKSDIVGYKHGGIVDYTGLAMLHGTKSKPEFVLNNDQMKSLLSSFSKPRTSSVVSANGGNVTNYNFGNVELPNVSNAKQFITELKSLVNITKHQ